MAALFSGFVLVAERPMTDAVLKAAVLVPIISTADIAWLVAGAAMTRHLREPAVSRAINVTFAILLLASVAVALLL